MAFNGILADLTELAAVDITDPKGDGSVSLSPGFFVQVSSPGNGSPSTWFTLEDIPGFNENLENWSRIAGGRTGNEVWISSGNISAANNLSPIIDFLPEKYIGIEWRSKHIYNGGLDTVEVIEVWTYMGDIPGDNWRYRPSVIDFPRVQPNTILPRGKGQMMYVGAEVYIANYDLNGWTLFVETGGAT